MNRHNEYNSINNESTTGTSIKQAVGVAQRYRNVRIATMTPGRRAYGLIDDAELVCEGGRILWAGPAGALPARYR